MTEKALVELQRVKEILWLLPVNKALTEKSDKGIEQVFFHEKLNDVSRH